VKHRLGVDTTKGRIVAIQGLGKVGMDLARRLHAEGATLLVADVNRDALRKAVDAFGAKEVSTESIVTTECDVLSPNALGAILNDASIPALHARVIAGGANNQLERDVHGDLLRDRDILYAPDYVINGGGIIRVAGQIESWSDADIERRVLAIAPTLTAIFERARREGRTTNAVADEMARERIARGRNAAQPRAAE
jgi:leucine dehydrogenase